MNRYSNEKVQIYNSYYHLPTDKKEIAEAYFNGNIDYILSRKESFDRGTNVGKRFLVVNTDNQYCGVLEVVSEELIAFKDLQAGMINYKIAGYKTFSKYKEDLFQRYQRIGKILHRKFTEDSLVVYLKVKVLEKF